VVHEDASGWDLRSPADESVLVHGDLGLHNITIDPVTDRLVGLFDFEGATFGDRHQDFVYMILLDGAIDAYERASQVVLRCPS
jgi:aminoglycoside phosphotransferase (APT) family kinase protein